MRAMSEFMALNYKHLMPKIDELKKRPPMRRFFYVVLRLMCKVIDSIAHYYNDTIFMS